MKVTQLDIDKGEAKECCFCPVALAINEALLEGYESLVDPTAIGIFKTDLCKPVQVITPVPTRVVHFIHDFDHGLLVKPFEFDLTIKAEFLKEANVSSN